VITLSLFCSSTVNVTRFLMGDIFTEQLRGDKFTEQ
jgi:hypothetical protein